MARSTTFELSRPIRVILYGRLWTVNRSPTDSMDFEVAVDFINSGWGDAVDELINLAKTGRLTELAEALAQQ
jgi:hypothetical protein